MRILFDEDAPRPLRRHLSGHDVKTVQEMGWSGKKNGELLDLSAENGFDVFLTFDQNLVQQQNLTGRPIAIVVMVAPNKRMDTLIPMVPDLLTVLSCARPGTAYSVSGT